MPHARLASELIPDNALARSTTGLLLLKAGDFAGARHELQAAVLLDPHLWAARYNLACAHVGLTNYPLAIELLTAVVSNQPAFRSFLPRDPALQPLREEPTYRPRLEQLAGVH
jgi:Flp pilus assembly protein TadD